MRPPKQSSKPDRKRPPVTEEDRSNNAEIFTQFSALRNEIQDGDALPDESRRQMKILMQKNSKLESELSELRKTQAQTLKLLKQLAQAQRKRDQ